MVTKKNLLRHNFVTTPHRVSLFSEEYCVSDGLRRRLAEDLSDFLAEKLRT